MSDLIRELVESPRKDNSGYLDAMAAAREAFRTAEAAFDCPVRVKIKTRIKRNGDHVVKFVFQPGKRER